ncbi:hypothetical protein K8S19_00330 [bacterium]|nr:hypothetical protein [bacterium]
MANSQERMLKIRRRLMPAIVLLVLIIIVVIRFSQLSEKTREGTTVGNLYQIRQAVLLYYQDHNGIFPRELSPGSPYSRYMEELPAVDHLHPRGGVLSPVGNEVTYGNSAPEGYGSGWYYNYESGQIFINSIGLDSRGISYSAY